MAKILKFDSDAREKLLKGINTLTEAVAATLGPKGRNVAIDRKFGAPNVVHDGVTVAKEIELEDPFENMGAQLLKEAASKTNDVAGDGTTTATVLAQAIVSEGLKNIQAGSNPMVLRRGMEQAATLLVESLQKMSKKLTTRAEIEQVATISAQNEEIGKLIANALSKVGKDGVITVEEGKTLQMSLDHKEGMEFDKGYASPYFVTDSEKMEATIEDPYILITDKKLSDAADFVKFLEKFIQISKNLVIISDDIEGDLMTMLVLNKLKGVFNFLAVGAPGFGDRRKDMLSDIAVLTGGVVISEDLGRKWESVEVEELGRASRVTSSKDNTLIVDGKGKKGAIESRVNVLRKELQSAEEFEKERLSERLAKLTGGVAVINVGAATEVEMREKKERVIDAVSATKAAIEEGIVPGGETALLRAALSLEKLKVSDQEEQLGVDLVKKALQKPFERLMQNSGLNPGMMMAEVLKSADSFGVDVMDGKVKDLIKAGIIDPVKVTRSALQNAVSVAVMVMTTHVLITDAPERHGPPHPPHHGMEDY